MIYRTIQQMPLLLITAAISVNATNLTRREYFISNKIIFYKFSVRKNCTGLFQNKSELLFHSKSNSGKRSFPA